MTFVYHRSESYVPMSCYKKYSLLCIVLFLSLAASATDSAYVRKINKERRDTDKFMRSGKSSLCVVARVEVTEGASTLGSDTASAIVLPQGPPRLGVLHRHQNDVSLEVVEGVKLRVNDKTPKFEDSGARSFVLHYSEGGKPGDRVTFGQYALTLRLQGDRFMLSFWDTQSPRARNFKGVDWFPVDEAYRVPAEFVPGPD